MSDAVGGASQTELLEGTARVVAIEAGTVWLEPEPAAGCGGCRSLAACGGSAGRGVLPARRFCLTDVPQPRLGERVVVGIPEGALLHASAVAYAIPLLTMLAAGTAAARLGGGGDGAAALGALGGLAAGAVIAHAVAGRLAERGRLAPRFVRRLSSDAGATAADPHPDTACQRT